MATIGLALADAEAYTSQMGSPQAAVTPADTNVDQFSAAMQKAMANAGPMPAAPQMPDPPKGVTEAAKSEATAAQERARRGLNLEAPHAPANTQGDTILDGLQKIRGMFDAHHLNMKSLVSLPAASTTTLMAIQMEVTNYSLLCTITSELAGKSTQTFDTLLKGQ
jgi:hypothetical protein